MPKISQDGKRDGSSHKQSDCWVFLVNNEAVVTECVDGDIQPSLCKLRHPRLNSECMYLFSANCLSVYEINCYQEKYRSWFIGNAVHSDGRMYMTSLLDPLFLVLPYLVRAKEKSGRSQFMTLDQMVYDEDFPDCHKLLTCCRHDQLMQIADSKDLEDNILVYQYSQEKTLCWLQTKSEMLADALKDKKVSVDNRGSHSTIFARSKNCQTSRDVYLEYAHGIISDYLSGALAMELRQCLGLPEVDASLTTSPVCQTEKEPPNKKAKLTTTTTVLSPTDDYSKNVDFKSAKSKTGKLTIAQKKLGQVDKSGIKSISSFFSSKV
uniref:Ribonuclease H2 subunit B n=1 Tax=Arion vulgaris TaxID=1028688 RepID=A0A0B7A3N9_9EUPU